MAFTASLGVSVALVWLLLLPTPRIRGITLQRPTITVTLLPQTPDTLPAPRSRKQPSSPRVVATPVYAEVVQSARPDALENPLTTQPTAAASAPIQIDQRLIRQSAQDGKSNFRKLVESSGTYAGDTPKTESEKLGHAVDAATKPDCFDRSGAASLFSIPIMIYRAAKDKCK